MSQFSVKEIEMVATFRCKRMKIIHGKILFENHTECFTNVMLMNFVCDIVIVIKIFIGVCVSVCVCAAFHGYVFGGYLFFCIFRPLYSHIRFHLLLWPWLKYMLDPNQTRSSNANTKAERAKSTRYIVRPDWPPTAKWKWYSKAPNNRAYILLGWNMKVYKLFRFLSNECEYGWYQGCT